MNVLKPGIFERFSHLVEDLESLVAPTQTLSEIELQETGQGFLAILPLLCCFLRHLFLKSPPPFFIESPAALFELRPVALKNDWEAASKEEVPQRPLFFKGPLVLKVLGQRVVVIDINMGGESFGLH